MKRVGSLLTVIFLLSFSASVPAKDKVSYFRSGNYKKLVFINPSLETDTLIINSLSEIGPNAVVLSNELLLFSENFDDANLSSRGWFDDTTPNIDNSVYRTGGGSIKFTFQKNSLRPDLSGAFRHSIPETENLYVSYWVKFDSNWVGSGRAYHPHIIFILSSLDNPYGGLAHTNLTLYIEHVNLYPQLALQDGETVNTSHSLPFDFSRITVNRSVTCCNGTVGHIGTEDCSAHCYPGAGTAYESWRVWKYKEKLIAQDTDWHHVEVYISMNKPGIANGVLRYLWDGITIMNYINVEFRTASTNWGSSADNVGASTTGENQSAKNFKTFVLSPFIGNGSPQLQTFWLDELIVKRFDAITTPKMN